MSTSIKRICYVMLCARLNWQLACQFSSANNISYRIVLSESPCCAIELTEMECVGRADGHRTAQRPPCSLYSQINATEVLLYSIATVRSCVLSAFVASCKSYLIMVYTPVTTDAPVCARALVKYRPVTRYRR